jgi:hypothetical protein
VAALFRLPVLTHPTGQVTNYRWSTRRCQRGARRCGGLRAVSVSVMPLTLMVEDGTGAVTYVLLWRKGADLREYPSFLGLRL